MRWHKELKDLGVDAGAETIHFHMSTPGTQRPVGVDHPAGAARPGFVTPNPKKRPKCSRIRFAADFPNECWQGDVTHVEVAEGVVFEVLNMLDDHSRLCVASRAFVTTKGPYVVRTLHKAAEHWGYPRRFLSDNGRIFTSPMGVGVGVMEAELLAYGIETRHSRPYHPQTCGKVERFHQRHEEVLGRPGSGADEEAAPGPARLLRRVLQHHPSASKPWATPCSRGLRSTGEGGSPREPRSRPPGYRIRRDPVDKAGRATLRYKGKLHHIGVGNAYAGWRVVLLVDGLDVQIIGFDGSPLRHLTLDPEGQLPADAVRGLTWPFIGSTMS